jgi:hypothetical protein
MKGTLDYYICKSKEAQQHAEALTDAWLRKSLEEIAYCYWLLAARVVKDDQSSFPKGEGSLTSAASISAWPA